MRSNLQAYVQVNGANSRSHLASGVLSSAGTAFASAVLFPLAVSITGLRRFLLAIIVLDIPLRIGTHLFWSEELGASGAVGGLEVSITTIALLGLYLLWFIGYVSRREVEPGISLYPALPLALYVAFETLSLYAARDPIVGLYEVILTAQMLFLFMYLINWIQTRNDITFVIRLLLIGLVLEAGIMIGLNISGQDVEIPGLPGHTLVAGAAEGAEEFSRPSGTLASPNVAGSYLSVMLTAVIGLLLITRAHGLHKTTLWISLALGLVALLMTYSRGGWLALFGSTLLSCYLGWRFLPPRRKSIVIGAAAVLFVSLLFDTPISRRLLQSDEGAAHSRIALNKLAITMIEDHALIGVGVNNFTLNLREYATHEFMGDWLYAVHNKYLLVWAEAGLGGLLAYLWFLSASLRRGWQCWKSRDPLYSPLALALGCGIFALIICDMFQSDRGRPLMQLLMFMAALIGTIHSWITPDCNGRYVSPIRVEAIPRQQVA